MTDNAMREAMIDQGGAVWEEIGGAWSMYWPAQSVQVVGEPVAWVNINKHGDITRTVSRRDNWCTTPVYRKPKTSTPAADLATLREKAAEADELRKDAEKERDRLKHKIQSLCVLADLKPASDASESLCLLHQHIQELASMADELRKDAERYRWIRDKSHSLETRQYDKGIVNGPSCYHEVEGIRELKYEGALDAAIDAAIAPEVKK